MVAEPLSDHGLPVALEIAEVDPRGKLSLGVVEDGTEGDSDSDSEGDDA